MVGNDLCPVCGENVRLTGITTTGRLIGSCGDAFTVGQWTDDSHGFPSVAMHAGHFAGYNITGRVYAQTNAGIPIGTWMFRIVGRPWMGRLPKGEKVALRRHSSESEALRELAQALVAIDELKREPFVDPVSAY